MRQLTIIFSFFVLLNTKGFGQTRCDTLKGKKIFVVTEVPPTSSISFDELERLLNSNINIDNFEKPKDNMVYLTFIINCQGQAFDYKFLRPVDQKLQDKLIDIFKANVIWKPAQQNKKLVDVEKTISIKIESNNKLNILTEEPRKKKK